jgi:hypothetical protein
MSTATGGRVVCPKCGANNFDTQAACWKCSTPLTGGGYVASPPVGVGAPPSVTPSNVAPVSPYAAPMPYRSAMDPSVAFWATISLALIFPYIAIPVGMVFLMLDDRRKAELGRMAIIWGIVFTLIQTVVTGLLLQGLVANLFSSPFLKAIISSRSSSDPNQKVAPFHMEGEVPEQPVNFPTPPPVQRPMPR